MEALIGGSVKYLSPDDFIGIMEFDCRHESLEVALFKILAELKSKNLRMVSINLTDAIRYKENLDKNIIYEVSDLNNGKKVSYGRATLATLPEEYSRPEYLKYLES